MTLELIQSLLGFVTPKEIIDNFELVSINEKSDTIVLEFEELSDLVPEKLKGKRYKNNGFWNKIDLHTFPQKGKSCLLHIKRRKWEDQESGKSYGNHYELHPEGMKATKDFGAFIKKNHR